MIFSVAIALVGALSLWVSAALPGDARSAPRRQTRAAARLLVKQSLRCRHRNYASGAVNVGVWAGAPSSNVTDSALPAVWDDVFGVDGHGRLTPLLASVVPTLANGGITNAGKTVTVHLKKGLRWSNGAEITSVDFRFGWRVFEDPAAGDACIYACSSISRVDTPGRYTAVFRLKRPDRSLLYFLSAAGPGGLDADPFPAPPSWPPLWDRDPHAAANTFSIWSAKRLVIPQNGAYHLVSSGGATAATLRPMKYYSTTPCGARIAGVSFRGYSTAAQLIRDAVGRRVDIVTGVPPDQLALLLRSAGPYRVHVDPAADNLGELQQHVVAFNLDPRYERAGNPVSDSRVRLALALAVDKQRLLARAWHWTPKNARNYVSWTPLLNTPGYKQQYVDTAIRGQWDPIAGRFRLDTGHSLALADARKLLARTRWNRGFSLDLYTVDNDPIMRAEEKEIASDWARIGVRTVPRFVSRSLLLSPFDQGGMLAWGAFQAGLFPAVVGPGADVLQFDFGSKFSRAAPGPPRGQNMSDIDDPLIDRAFGRVESAPSESVRSAGFATIQREVNQKAYWIPLHSEVSIWTDDGRVRHLAGSVPTAEWSLNP
jgi:ABC-type transport system substrate-binding protein